MLKTEKIKLTEDTEWINFHPENSEREVGGILLGNDKYVTHVIQVKGKKETENEYELPNKFIILLKILKYLLIKDVRVVGEWHLHPNGFPNPSEADKKIIERRVETNKKWVLGIVTQVQNPLIPFTTLSLSLFHYAKEG